MLEISEIETIAQKNVEIFTSSVTNAWEHDKDKVVQTFASKLWLNPETGELLPTVADVKKSLPIYIEVEFYKDIKIPRTTIEIHQPNSKNKLPVADICTRVLHKTGEMLKMFNFGH